MVRSSEHDASFATMIVAGANSRGPKKEPSLSLESDESDMGKAEGEASNQKICETN
jgi:hypothetical protein